MKKILLSLLSLCLLVSCANKGPVQPNIFFLMVDDLGKEWVSCYGAEDIQTPHIDRLAANGIQFNNVYCMPQCTPTRVTLLTGQYPFRHGWVNHWDVPRWGGGVHFDETLNPSLARYMKEAGYVTAVAGKWQINDFRVEPDAMTKHGFDHYCMWTGYEMGVDASVNRYWDAYTYEQDGNHTYKSAFGPDVFTDFLIDFILDNKDTSWFAYYPMVLTHGPLVNPPGTNSDNGLEKHKAMVRYTDKLTGQIYSAIESSEQLDRTIFIWTTDNGTSQSIRGHRDGHSIKGGKALTSENGICVPFIVTSPWFKNVGEKSEALIDFTDLLPTFLELAGAPIPDGHTFDGQSFAPILTGEKSEGSRAWILGMGGGNNAQLTSNGMENQYVYRDRVLRNKQYKLWIGKDGLPKRFFDLTTDPFEQSNLLDQELTSDQNDHFTKLLVVAKDFPTIDKDPVYQPTLPQEWDRVVKKSAKIK